MSDASDRILTVPNLLSFVRLLLIPVFLALLVSGEYGWAILTLAVASVTDYVDGVVARRFRQITKLGQLLDPAADRLYILATIIGLAWQGFLPWWLVVVVVARDLLLLGIGVLLAQHGFGPLPVHHLGKVATFTLLSALPILLLGAAVPATSAVALPLGLAAAIWGAFLYWWAGVLYLRQAVRLVRNPGLAGRDASDSVDA